jgi:hypothetical protein
MMPVRIDDEPLRGLEVTLRTIRRECDARRRDVIARPHGARQLHSGPIAE